MGTRRNGHLTSRGVETVDDSANERDWPAAPVALVMTRNPICVAADTDAFAARDIMLEHRVGALPVVDSYGVIVGVVTKTDLLRDGVHLSDALIAETDGWGPVADRKLSEPGSGYHVARDAVPSVAELMTPFVRTIAEDTSIADAASIMLNNHVHQLVVTSTPTHRPIGVVSNSDILRWLLGQAFVINEPASSRSQVRKKTEVQEPTK